MAVVVRKLWVAFAYAPAHFLRDWNYGKVTIDGRSTPAAIFIAHPWDGEAEAVALIHTPTTEDFFLSFGQEKVHIVPKRQYFHVPGGVWSFSSLREMAFEEPLPPQHLNEFRFRSHSGGVVSVQF